MANARGNSWWLARMILNDQTVEPEKKMALIQAKNITKNYVMGDQQVPALKDISFEIGEGAFAAFVGPSGSGKSTLLNLIGCLDHPSSGTLWVHGTDISTLSRSAAATFRGEHLALMATQIPPLVATSNSPTLSAA
jgi:ABC-type lipoprotein export system ATPase subunit